MRRFAPVFALLFACSSGSDPTGPEIVDFSAAELLVEPGAKTTLSWNVARVSTISIAPQGASNLLTDSPKPEGSIETNAIDDHTVFVLRATGLDGAEIGASVLVRVNFPAPVVDEFTAAPMEIDEGERTLLRWATSNATEVDIVDGDGNTIVEAGPPDDTMPVEPARSQTYTLTARGPGGEITETADVIVVGTPPTVSTFEARPETIFAGESARLAWEVLNANTVTIRTAEGAEIYSGAMLTAMQQVSPTADTDYFLTARNDAGTATASVSIAIRPPAAPNVVRFEASPNPLAIGDRVTLSWEVDEARALSISARGVVVFNETDGPRTGSTDVVVTATATQFTLVADNTFGSATAQVDVYGHLAPQVTAFTATPQLIAASTSITLDYATTDVARLDLLANGAPVPGFTPIDRTTSTTDAAGMVTATASVTTTYTLVASSGAGDVRAYQTVVNGVAEIEPNDDAGSAMVLAGRDVAAALADASDVDVYAVDVPEGGAVFAQTSNGPTYCGVDTQLTLYDTDGTSPLVFDDDDGLDTCSRIDPATDLLAAALPEGRYFLVVDSGGAGMGAYVLTTEVRGPSCGDGSLEAGEQCDDGNQIGGDGCDASCMFEHGPAVTPNMTPTTVTVNLNGGFGVIAVDPNRAGQAIAARATGAGDTCDAVDTAVDLYGSDGLVGTAAGGGPTGAAGTCGAIRYPNDTFALNRPMERHYILVRSENGATGPVEVVVNVRDPSCGNGIRESLAGEQCDDNNQVAGDGCDASCQLESGLFPEIEPNGTQATANSSGLSGAGLANVEGANTPSGDDDVYSFTVPANTTLRLNARTYSAAGQPMSCDSGTTDTRLFLEAAGTEVSGPMMGELAFNDDVDNANNVWCSALTDVLVAGGPAGATYFIRVQGWQDTGTTSYFLELRLDP